MLKDRVYYMSQTFNEEIAVFVFVKLDPCRIVFTLSYFMEKSVYCSNQTWYFRLIVGKLKALFANFIRVFLVENLKLFGSCIIMV